MTEKQIKIVSTLGKIGGTLTGLSDLLAHNPNHTLALVGTGIVLASSVLKDVVMFLNDLWDSTPSTPAASGGSSTIAKTAALLAIGGLALGLVVAGCQSTPQKVAYESAGTAVVSVDTAMNLWGAYVAANHPPAAQEQAVKSAFEKYQAAMAVACDAGAAYAASSITNSAATAGMSPPYLALHEAIENAGVELADLENLIQSFGVKLQ